MREQAGGHQGQGWQSWKTVVLLPAGEGEEPEDKGGPEKKREGCFQPDGIGVRKRVVRKMRFELRSNSCLSRDKAVAQVGHPVRAQSADVANDGGDEKGCPGHDPEDAQQPEQRNGDLAIVVRYAMTEKAGDVFVVEIEPSPAAVSREPLAGRKGDCGSADGGENVPWRGDPQKDSGGCPEVQPREQTKLSRDREVRKHEPDGEDQSDEALGENVERHHAGEAHAWNKRRAILTDAVEGDEEEMNPKGHPERKEDVGNKEARVEIRSDTGGQRKGGVEASAIGRIGRRDGPEEADAQSVDGEEKRQYAECERKAGSPVVGAEDVHGGGCHPVHQGRFVEEAHAVDVRGDVIVAHEHLSRDLGVDGVDVVEQAWGKEASNLKNEPGDEDDRD